MLEVTVPAFVDEESLAALFALLDASRFHPHPLTSEEARARCHYRGSDEYRVVRENGHVIAYGMLRGWDEGYDRPALGLCVHPLARGRGVGSALARYLVGLAKERGAREVWLKVNRDNAVAIRLYRAIGFRLEAYDETQLQGVLAIAEVRRCEDPERSEGNEAVSSP